MNPGNAWRAGERAGGTIACSLYLSRHSDYLDGGLSPEERLMHEAHEAVCGPCAHYASVLRRSSSMLRELPDVVPSSDFHERLQHRLYHLQDASALAPGRTRWNAWLAAAAGLVLLAGGNLLLDARDGGVRDTVKRETAPTAELRTAQLADSWTTPAVPLATAATPLPANFAGYSPVVVRPPLYQPVSYELLLGE